MPFNLIEVQTALQSPSVQTSDLLKYAQGNSAEVPGYLAAAELLRRKQIEETNTNFNAKPPTILAQLTSTPPAVNPTAAPTGIAPTGAPQLASAVAAPPRMNVAAAPANQVNPIAPPQMAAEGGLLSIPTPHMFHPESYANGGIVAFEEGGDVPYVERPTFFDKLTGKAKAKQEKFDRQSKMLAADFSGDASDLELPANAPPHPYSIEKFLNDEQRAARRKVEGTDVNHPSPVNPAEDKRQALLKAKAEQAAADKARHNALVAQVPTFHVASDGTIKGTKPVEEPVAVAAPVAQTGVASLPRNKPVDDFNSRPAAGIAPVAAAPVAAPVLPPVTVERDARQDYKALTADERQAAIMKQADNDKILREKYGISDDPHKDTRGRMDKLEAKRAAQEAEDPFNSLMARIATYGASKEQTFGGAMGESAIAGAKASKETAALRDKQAVEMIAVRQAMETAEDARKRGDLTAVKAAEESAEKHTEKFKELGIQQQQANASTTQAESTALHANSEAAWKQFDEETKRIVADAAMRHARNPELTEGQRKANAIKDIMTLKKVDFLEATRLYAIAENAGKLEGLDEKLHQQNLKGWNDLKIAGQSIYNSKAKKEGQGRSGRDLFMEERGEAPSQPAGIPTVSTPTARKVPTQASVDFLMKHPNTIAEFDAKFGAGSAATYLGRNTAIPIQDVQRQKEQY